MSGTLPAEKQALRKAMRLKRPALQVRQAESEALCGHLAAFWRQSAYQAVAAYMPLPWEADISPFLATVLAEGVPLLLPRVAGDTLIFHQVADFSQLRPGTYGILEPPETLPEADLTADTLILTPLEALDPAGHRLGKGGGYYDRLWQDHPVLRTAFVGCVLGYQWVIQVPHDAYDMRLMQAVDANGLHALPSG